MAAVLLFFLLFSLQSLLSPVSAKIYDITHQIRQDLPSKANVDKGLGQFLWPSKGSTKLSIMKLTVHSVTHLDAPGHYIDRYFDAGYDVDTLDLAVLNGPALLVDVPKEAKKITARVMESLSIPKGVTRVIFRTSNTERRLMYKKEYDRSFVGFSGDGAKWLVENTQIKLIGIDYFSVGADDESKEAHEEFLENKEIIPVEALKLDDVPAGLYTSVHCLPLRLLGSEGSPVMESLLTLGMREVQMGTDCSDIFRLTSNPEDWPAFASYLEDFKRLKGLFSLFTIHVIPRNLNLRADILARNFRG